MATQAELTAALKQALTELRAGQPTSDQHEHIEQPVEYECDECGHKNKVCKNCGGSIKKSDDEDEDEDDE